MKPKSTPPKKKRKELTHNEMEALEHADWLEDLKERERKRLETQAGDRQTDKGGRDQR